MRTQNRRSSRRGSSAANTPAAPSKEPKPSDVAQAPASEPRVRSSKRSSRGLVEPSSLDNLPIEVIQSIGNKLSPADLRTCRLVCRLWAHRIAQGVETVSLCMHPDQDMARRKLDHIKRLFPGATEAVVHVSNRQPQGTADLYIKELQSIKHLRSLQVIFRGQPGSEPKWPLVPLALVWGARSLKPVCTITQLTSLTLQDFALHTADANSLVALKSLTKLAFTSHDNYQTASLEAWRSAQAIGYTQEDLPYSASAETMITLCNLTGLRHLEVPVSKAAANKFSSWGLQQLNRLTCLITHGHPFKLTPTDMAESPESSMDSSMGVCSSQASSWLSCMPELQELHIPLPRTSSFSTWGLDEDTVLSSQLRTLSLVVCAHDDVAEDLAYVAKLKSKLHRLVLRASSIEPQDVSLLTQLRPLKHLEVYLLHSLTPFSSVLGSLTSAIHLQSCVCNRPFNCSPVKDPGLHASLAMLAGVSDNLQRLELDGLLDVDFESVTAHVLKRFNRLRSLSLKCADNTRCKLPVNLSLLPSALEQLHLRFVQLQGLNPRHINLPNLNTLTLTNCATDNMRQFLNVLGNLYSLTSLQLENLNGLNDDYVRGLASLTGLTSLGVLAVSNHAVTNASLGELSTLTELRKLTWHVGDMLDATPEVSLLKAFKKLLLLSLTTSMYFRLQRWSALSVLDFLPHCQIESVGP